MTELERALAESTRWREEWIALIDCVRRARDSQHLAEKLWLDERQKVLDMGRRVSDLEVENQQLRELVRADAVQIALLERQVERLKQSQEVERVAC